MAKIVLANFAQRRTGRVGNNRTVEFGHDGTCVCRLHGHPVVQFHATDTSLTMTVDTCGYSTATTRQAMRDFIEAYTGYPTNVSLAKGRLTVSVGNRQVIDTDKPRATHVWE